MKKNIITLLLAAMPVVAGFAQSKAFDRFEDKKGINVIVLSDDMVNLFGEIIYAEQNEDKKADTKKYLDKVKDLSKLRAFVTSDKKHIRHMKSAMTDYLKENNLVEAFTINKEKKQLRFYVKTDADTTHVKDLVILTENLVGDEVALVTFIGDLNLNDTALTNTTTKEIKK